MTDQTNETATSEQTQPTGTAPGQQAGKTERTFTQAELDSIIAERLKRQKDQFADYPDLKKKAEQWQAYEDAQKSEQQKLQEQLTAATAKAAEADLKRKAALIRAAVVAEASKPGMVAGDRIEAAYKLLDTSALTIDDNDNVTGVTDAIKALLETNPFLKAEPEKPGSVRLNPTNPQGGGSQEGVKSWHPLYAKKDGGFRGVVIPPPGETNK